MCRKIPQIRLNFAAMVKYALIIPVFNRPDEVDELLQSLTAQTFTDFEVVVVEDGSAIPCKDVVGKYAGSLTIHYYTKENGGPGKARNYGVARAEGEYVIILDSDIVLPDKYIESVTEALYPNGLDGEPSCEAFGGPDRAHFRFTPIQKAINYGMTSFFTTGGIRGGDRKGKHGPKLDKFYPRSYNMGIRRDVYNRLGGFSKMRFGEDIDFSYRIVEAGYTSRLFPEAWVWHKRRTDMDKFFKQVFNSGIARINLTKRHPGTLKLVHLLPMVFTLGVLLLIAGAVFFRLWDYYNQTATGLLLPNGGFIPAYALCLLPIALYMLLIFVDSSIKNKSVVIGFLSVEAAFVQLMGYGFGFLKAWWLRCVQGKDEFTAFEKNFYD